MAKNNKMIDKIIDDVALGKYDSVEEAVEDLVYYGLDPEMARNSVLAMAQVDVI